MKLEHDYGIYPPRVRMSARDIGSIQNLTISFTNVQGADLDIDTTLPPSTYMYISCIAIM